MPVLDPQALKIAVLAALWRATDQLPPVLSATLAGSFATGSGLDGFSDIDTILVVDDLDAARFANIQEVFRAELAPVLAAQGWQLRINATLGPLKFNDAQTAVLHLMLYSAEGHRDHVIKSPFTCFDWQRSNIWRKAPMAAVYPVFSLQPRHFFGARRSAKDYLADLREGVISYRELAFDGGYHEVKRGKPMEVRDRHEFAYHILRFLMQNLLKLVQRTNTASEGEALIQAFAGVFPQGMEVFGPLYLRLARMKKAVDFTDPVTDLLERITGFANSFEQQFRDEFEHQAYRQVWFRHAPTELNKGQGLEAILQGRSDSPLLPLAPEAATQVATRLATLGIRDLVASPLTRATATARLVADAVAPDLPIATDADLLEINYGACEGLTARAARSAYPVLAEGWAAGTDPRFPGGENSADVRARVQRFLKRERRPLAVATHNVVLRELLGEAMGVPADMRHRLRIPHLTPIELVFTRRFGHFADLAEATEAACFSGFFSPAPSATIPQGAAP